MSTVSELLKDLTVASSATLAQLGPAAIPDLVAALGLDDHIVFSCPPLDFYSTGECHYVYAAALAAEALGELGEPAAEALPALVVAWHCDIEEVRGACRGRSWR